MRYALLALMLVGCSPSDAEMEDRYTDAVIAEAEYNRLQAKIDSVASEAPTEDSMRAVLRGPLMDSLGVAAERLRAAERRYSQ